MVCRKIFLTEYPVTFVMSDLAKKENINIRYEDVVLDYADKMMNDFFDKLNVMDNMNDTIYHFFEEHYYIEITKTRNPLYLEDVVHIKPYIMVDTRFYKEYHSFLSKFL